MLSTAYIPADFPIDAASRQGSMPGLRTLPDALQQWARRRRYHPEKIRDARHDLKALLWEALPRSYGMPSKLSGKTQCVRLGPLEEARRDWANYLDGGRDGSHRTPRSVERIGER